MMNSKMVEKTGLKTTTSPLHFQSPDIHNIKLHNIIEYHGIAIT